MNNKSMHVNCDVIDKLNYKEFNQDFLQQQLILSLRNQMRVVLELLEWLCFTSDATLAFYLANCIVW